MPYAALGLVTLCLWVFCLIDVIMSPESEIRQLPKALWLIIVIILPTIGALLWLLIGRPVNYRSRPASTTRYPEYDRPGRHVAQNPEDDEEFLQRLRERAESQRREARRQEEARQAEQERRRRAGEL
ncbi:PLDc_N domain-containing protein [Nocardia terpenica]|uniref:PLD nuclease N-terminal domain-containing protein n=1 Tax=Nocardia terpenica TaxID=455432 RepID=UPI001895E4DE|nr:PLD nuclease N-terminal domain-containing protein [Nocardia terpenica]MBF6060317.1 PLDc_N domain-containing protein [Nocardia terpenica]MBF6103577.1 PLDc_N domain-containing protein [Nocardia terpenica]MBF6112049.1 PLDc_N domain-containing protein [Nocardia terpenica]MBF6117798.1 PLDc_N domain-containing protein [Nocardia terpenica]MBF6153458.1 PLDc_N domain-containing protein [Nocardia terpenica]